jgi:hypothetical protein
MKTRLAGLIVAALVLTPMAASGQYYGGGPRHQITTAAMASAEALEGMATVTCAGITIIVTSNSQTRGSASDVRISRSTGTGRVI